MLKLLKRILSGPPAPAPYRGLASRDPALVGPNPTVLKRLFAIKLRVDIRYFSALASKNSERVHALQRRAERLIVLMRKESLPLLEAFNTGKKPCDCPLCRIERALAEGSVSVEVVEIKPNAPATPMKAEAELNDLVARMCRKAKNN